MDYAAVASNDIESLDLSAGIALWDQREALSRRRTSVINLREQVGKQLDLSLPQWMHLMAMALEFKPDLILELGRLAGNSTCAFTEVANELGAQQCRVVSICLTFSNASRVFVFWDAHGFDVASCVLGRILPLLTDRSHVVAMHDISDAR